MEWGQFVEWLRHGVTGGFESFLQLLLAAALGGMIGLEREHSGKPAGFRTNLLICLGAALVMQLSMSVSSSVAGAVGTPGDPGRIGAQIVSGIGFLGAGTILHFRGNVVGLTTAATLWVVAAIGMAVGAAAYVEAVAATFLVMLTLMLLGRIEDHLIPRKPTERTMDLTIGPGIAAVQEVEAFLLRAGFATYTVRMEKQDDHFCISYNARGDSAAWDRIMNKLLALDVVKKVELF